MFYVLSDSLVWFTRTPTAQHARLEPTIESCCKAGIMSNTSSVTVPDGRPKGIEGL